MKNKLRLVLSTGLVTMLASGTMLTADAQTVESKLYKCMNKYNTITNSIIYVNKDGKICQVTTKPGCSNPDTSVKPEVPSIPEEPETPNEPEVPSIPEEPETPSNPDSDNSTNNSFSAFQKEVTDLVNDERAKVGAKPLKLNEELSNVATIKSQDMIDKNYFDHTSPTYGSPFDMMKKFGISYKTAGENIAMGQKTPKEVVTAWMNSSGHRANILNPNFTEIGVGVAKNSKGSIYWTQMFIGK